MEYMTGLAGCTVTWADENYKVKFYFNILCFFKLENGLSGSS